MLNLTCAQLFTLTVNRTATFCALDSLFSFLFKVAPVKPCIQFIADRLQNNSYFKQL